MPQRRYHPRGGREHCATTFRRGVAKDMASILKHTPSQCRCIILDAAEFLLVLLLVLLLVTLNPQTIEYGSE